MSKPTESHTFGITSPISVAEPQESDLKASQQLEECLREYGLFESELEMQHRMNILSKLNDTVQTWIKDVSAKKMPKHSADQMSGKIFTFGSYRLGVHTKGFTFISLFYYIYHKFNENRIHFSLEFDSNFIDFK